MKRIALAVLALAAIGCARGSVEDGRVDVVASFYPIAEAAERIGGDDVSVTNLTPPGVEPHDIELTADQLDAVIDADVVLYLGGGFQPAIEDVLDRATGEVVDVAEGLVVAGDPHVWLDPVLFVRISERIGRALDADPLRYVRVLDDLDEEMSRGLSGCDRQVLVTSHAAFAYLADRFGLEQHAVSGLSPEAEPDPERLAELADLVRDEGVTTIFTETLVSPKVARTLARETGVDVATLDPIEGLTPEQIGRGEDYASVMRANLDALREGLGCN